MAFLVHQFISESAARTPGAEALVCRDRRLTYADLAAEVATAAGRFAGLGIERGGRVGVFLDKRTETVTAMFGAATVGGVFVPINPLLKAPQVAYMIADCGISILVTSVERLAALTEKLAQCPTLRSILVVGASSELPKLDGVNVIAWDDARSHAAYGHRHPVIDADIAAIFYTSGSTGKPKGVVLSHRNLVAGAISVAGYLGNTSGDRILCVLPLSFDYGFSQLTTAFYSGATAVLLNHLFAKDVLTAVDAEKITGLAAVPPLWMQLAELDWPDGCALRYLTNSGGTMPRALSARLRSKLPRAELFLMYGLTEAFRSTFLPPAELDTRPDSIGKAIPNAEVMVLRPDGTECQPDEPGELVHRGALVAQGYWNNPEATALKFRPIPARKPGAVMMENAVWSGDTVRRDKEGFLYFVGRRDELIKTSGYRVSPVEIEEALYGIDAVIEAAAIGVPHLMLGQAIVAVLYIESGCELSASAITAACRQQLPAYMVPTQSIISPTRLPKNPNGKIDRQRLAAEYAAIFTGVPA